MPDPRTTLLAVRDRHDVAGLVRYALRVGLIPPESEQFFFIRTDASLPAPRAVHDFDRPGEHLIASRPFPPHHPAMKLSSKNPRLLPLPTEKRAQPNHHQMPTLIPVHFEYTDPTAISVAVAGSFNEWHPTTKTMQRSANGRWSKEAFLPPGRYEYCLVVDECWMPDPLATEWIANPFGGINSLLLVADAPRPAAPVPEKKLYC